MLYPATHLSHAKLETQAFIVLCDTQPLMRKSTAQSRSRVKAFLIIGLCLPIGAVLFLWLLAMPDVSALRATNPTVTALMEARQVSG